jgi:hypothetical protein
MLQRILKPAEAASRLSKGLIGLAEVTFFIG